MQLLLFVLSSAALTWILLRSPLFKKLREAITVRHLAYKNNLVFWTLSNLFGCAGCMGFWAGVFLYALRFLLSEIIFNGIQYGLIGSICSLIIIQIHLKLQ